MVLEKVSRRDLLVKGTTLSIAGLGLLTGLGGKALAGSNDATTAQDIDVLNVILGTEHEGIAAYQISIERKLLANDAARTALIFQSHHKTHRDILAEKIRALGGSPVAAKALDEYADDLDFVKIKSQRTALGCIAKLELGAANAYIGMLPSTNDHELIKTASRIVADEVLHWTTLSSLLHLPLPPNALFFGA